MSYKLQGRSGQFLDHGENSGQFLDHGENSHHYL